MTERTIKVRLEAEVSQYQKNMDEAAKATELLAAKSDVAAKKVDHAANVQKGAAEKVKAAEENLKKVRSDSKATADQVRAAEEGLTKAKLDESSASLTLRESTQGLEKAQRAQGDAAEIQSSKMKRAGAFWEKNRADIDKTATSLMVIGGAGVGALGLMAKQAISWESAWAGVTKTVNGTTQEMASLQAGLRQMATELPATHEEIAAVAEAAGQLGIQTPNILSFTRTMIDLGEATNLSAEEAATGLARFTNIMGTSQTEVGRLGSTIVGLGNNFATTESEILAMSMRLAGAGKQIGLSESDVMGLATALSSVGIEADAGGSAMSTVMKKINKEVETSGANLETYARVAGMSAEQFSTAWGQNAAGALALFVEGLADTEHMGMSASLVLDDLGVKGIRETDALLRMSGAQGLMNEALSLGADAYRENRALSEEALQRYATTESQMKMAANSIKDAGIEVGQYLLPVISDVSKGVADMAGWFANLPGPVKGTITALGGFGSVTALAVGGTLKLAGSMSDSILAARRLTEQMPRLGKGMGVAAKAAGVAAIAITGVLMATSYKGESKLQIEELHDAIIQLGNGAYATDTLFKNLEFKPGHEIDLKKFLDRLSDPSPFDSFFNGVNKAAASLNGDWANAFNEARTELEAFDEAMGVLVSTDLDSVARAFASMNMEAGGTSESAQKLLDQMPHLRDALIGVATELGVGTDDATLLKIALGELAPAADEVGDAAGKSADEVDELSAAFEEQKEAAEAAWSALNAWLDVALGVRSAEREFEAALDGISAALEKNGKTFDITTDKGRANEAALDGIASAGWNLIEQRKLEGASEEELQEIMQRTRDEYIKGAKQMGRNQDQAKALADELGLFPENINTEVMLHVLEAQETMHSFIRKLDESGSSLKDWDISADGTSAVHEATKTKAWIDKQTGEIKIEGKDVSATNEASRIATKINKTTANIPMTAHMTATGNAAIDSARAAIRTPISVPFTFKATNTLSGAIGGARPRAMGGRAGTGKPLPSFSVGGRLPRTGLGTDKILGINSAGLPTAWVDDEEMLVNKRMTDKFEDVLYRINADHPSVQHMANGAPPQYQTAPHVAMANPSAAIDYDRLAAAVVRAQVPVAAVVTPESAALIAGATGQSVGAAVRAGFGGVGSGVDMAVRAL